MQDKMNKDLSGVLVRIKYPIFPKSAEMIGLVVSERSSFIGGLWQVIIGDDICDLYDFELEVLVNAAG